MMVTVFSPLLLFLFAVAFLIGVVSRPFRGNLNHLKLLVENNQPINGETVLSYESQRFQSTRFRDRTRDDLCAKLRSLGVEAHLAQRGRKEEIAGISGAVQSLGIVCIDEGPIRWANVGKLDREFKDFYSVYFGVPDSRIGPALTGALSRFLFGRITRVGWQSKDELGLSVACRLEDDPTIIEAIKSGHVLSITANGELHCWLIKARISEAGLSHDTWTLCQSIADHLLATLVTQPLTLPMLGYICHIQAVRAKERVNLHRFSRVSCWENGMVR